MKRRDYEFYDIICNLGKDSEERLYRGPDYEAARRIGIYAAKLEAGQSLYVVRCQVMTKLEYESKQGA